jgi:hypothetical protein
MLDLVSESENLVEPKESPSRLIDLSQVKHEEEDFSANDLVVLPLIEKKIVTQRN